MNDFYHNTIIAHDRRAQFIAEAERETLTHNLKTDNPLRHILYSVGGGWIALGEWIQVRSEPNTKPTLARRTAQ